MSLFGDVDRLTALGGSIPPLPPTIKFKKDMATSNEVRCKKAMARKSLPIRELEKVWITTAEACELMNCTRDFLEDLRDDAELAWAKVAGKIYYEVASIHRMFERHRVQAKA